VRSAEQWHESRSAASLFEPVLEDPMPVVACLTLVAAALLEVGGDAIIRAGLRGSGLAVVAGGFIVLGSYGLLVNTLRWEFSRLLGVYVAVFATASVLCGRFAFGEVVATSTWLGLAIILSGAAVIQLGSQLNW
jgi:small multidrug resistance family-3 protein